MNMENNIMNTWMAVLHYSLCCFLSALNVYPFINKNRIIVWWTQLRTSFRLRPQPYFSEKTA